MQDKSHYIRLRDSLFEITRQVEPIFTETEKSEVFEYINVGEYGLAFDAICSIVLEKNRTVTREVYDRLNEVGNAMELNPSTWTKLRPPE